jgi:hypothetical protein
MRALGTTGLVAGAANYNSGLSAHSNDGLPGLRSPRSPCPGGTDPNGPLLPDKTFGEISCPYNTDRAHTGRWTKGRTPEQVIRKVKMWAP